MIIRSQQITELKQAARNSFQVRMADHLRRCFPTECARLGMDRLFGAIQTGIDRAAHHGFRLERDVCRYIDLMFAFGTEFDRELPWAARIFDEESAQTSVKLDRLYAAASLEESGV